MNYIAGHDRFQITMILTCVEDYISGENPVRVIDAFVDSLDLVELGFTHAMLSKTGRPPYSPGDLLKLYLYGYTNGIRSSRKLEKEAARNLEVIWLIRQLRPDYKTIADFRKKNKAAIREVFKQFVLLCRDWGMLSQELVAIDGSKYRAWNGRKRNFNQKKLEEKYAYLDAKISEYLEILEKADHEEEAEAKLTKSAIQKKIDELKARRKTYESYEDEIKEAGETQISLTDPDSRNMMYNQRVEVCYNVQTTVEAENKLIIDYEAINQVKDLGYLSIMSFRAKELLGVDCLEVLADKDYYKSSDFKECVDNDITPYVSRPENSNHRVHDVFPGDKFQYVKEQDVYICPSDQVLSHRTNFKKSDKQMKRYYNYEACAECKIRKQCTKSVKNGRHIERWIHQDIIDQIEANTKANLAKYKKRQTIVEHPFGTIKRGLNAYYLLTKGFESVSIEIGLIYCAYNLKRVSNILGVPELVRRLKALCLCHFRFADLWSVKWVLLQVQV